MAVFKGVCHLFSERFTAVTFGNNVMYMIADTQNILYIGTKAPSPMGLLRNDHRPLLQQAATELQEYFSGKIRQLSFAIHHPSLPFIRAVYTAASQIPYGSCVDAATIARYIGYPDSTHAIDVLCRSNPLSVRIPTHRIYPSDGISRAPDYALRQMERRFAAP